MVENQVDSKESTRGTTQTHRRWWVSAVNGALLVGLAVGSYQLRTKPEDLAASQAELMQAGLDALYDRNDPGSAVASFREVLDGNPTHYGATYQLAKALDQTGRSDEARAYWEKVLPMAEAAQDEKTAAAVRDRLASVDAPSELAAQRALMTAGLDALYQRNDPSAAAAEFRKILERNPSHYGATYQLATALDRALKRAEARVLWEKVLEMAERSSDKATAATARARLGEKP